MKPQHTREQLETMLWERVRREPELAAIETITVYGPIDRPKWNWDAEISPWQLQTNPTWESIRTSMLVEFDLKA